MSKPQKFFAALFPSLVAFTACDNTVQKFGGTQVPITYQSITEALIKSNDLIFDLDAEENHITLSGGYITHIRNKKISENYPMGSLDLVPDVASLGNLGPYGITIQPNSPNQKFRSSMAESLEFDSVTLIALMSSASRGNIFAFTPGLGDTEVFSLSMGASQITAKFQTDSSNYYQLQYPTVAGSDVLVAAAFSSESSEALFAINGALAPGTVVGAPVSPMAVNRSLTLGPDQVGQALYLKRAYLFKRALQKKELGAMILKIANEESVAGIKLDSSLELNPGTTDPNFPAVKVVLAKCSSCHADYLSAGASYFIAKGLVVKGDASSSKLYYRLTGSLLGSGPKNMPQAGSLSAEEVASVRTWVEKMP